MKHLARKICHVRSSFQRKSVGGTPFSWCENMFTKTNVTILTTSEIEILSEKDEYWCWYQSSKIWTVLLSSSIDTVCKTIWGFSSTCPRVWTCAEANVLIVQFHVFYLTEMTNFFLVLRVQKLKFVKRSYTGIKYIFWAFLNISNFAQSLLYKLLQQHEPQDN